MINQEKDNVQWQEWIFRVGCWLLVVGVHLWLLLFAESSNSLSWKNHNNASNDNSNSNDSLSISFSNKIRNISSNNSEGSEKGSDIHAVQDVSQKSIQKITNFLALNNNQKFSQSKKEFFKNNNVQKRDKKIFNKKEVVSVDKVESIENDLAKKEVEYQRDSDNHNQDVSNVENAIIYNPALAAPPVPPNYPEIARRKRQQGTVWLDVFLDKYGKQRELAIHKSSGVSVLDKAALHAVKQWQFSQYQKDIQSQLVTIRIPIEFSLN
ncbi:MAG: energy transducer TonB [Cellvibrionaceae bacterium]